MIATLEIKPLLTTVDLLYWNSHLHWLRNCGMRQDSSSPIALPFSQQYAAISTTMFHIFCRDSDIRKTAKTQEKAKHNSPETND